jgi:hypothetical protein
MKKILEFFESFKTKRLTKEEIINETVEFYSADISRRSIEGNVSIGNGCKYNHENGNHCAVGRLLLPKYQKQGTNLKGNANGISAFMDYQKIKKLDKALQKQYQGHKVLFWRDLQNLHDESKHWEVGGLTEIGKEFVEELKRKKY